MRQFSLPLLITLMLMSFNSHAAESFIEPGLIASVGVGAAPLYVEEIIVDDALTVGGMVIAFYTNAKIGRQIRDFSIHLTTSQNWYSDASGNIYAVGISGVGVTYWPKDFFKTYYSINAGLATKAIFGADTYADGSGINLGMGRILSDRLTLDINYNYLSLNKVATPGFQGDSAAISSLNIGLTYFWK